MNDIAKEIGAQNADPYELAQWLWNHFNGEISSTTRQTSICKDSVEILRVEFSRNQRLKALKVSDHFTKGDIAGIRDAINQDLLDLTNTIVGIEVFFSSFPVDGFFKFQDRLQIRPVPPGAPKVSGRAWGEHPFLVEFALPASRNFFVTSFRRTQSLRHLGAVLAVFLEGVITVRSNVMQGHWVSVPVNASTEEFQLESKYLAGQYIYPGLKTQASSFSSVEEYPAITQIPEQDYYTRWGQVLGRSLEIPDSLHKLFTLFFSLSSQERTRFVRSAYWFGQATSAYLVSKSYVYIALVMAIETLSEKKGATERCPKCHRELENGPTKNFQRFLDEYAPNFEGAKRLKAELYALRCDLIHGGKLFLEDMDARFLSLTPRMVEDQHKSDLLYRLTRIALINWLTKDRTA